MVRYMKCPRCELNYIDAEKQEYCDVCLKEMKGIPGDFDELDEEEDLLTERCPVCGENMMRPGEKMCDECKKKAEYEEDGPDPEEDDDEWREYLDDDTDADLAEEVGEIDETFDEDFDEEEEDEVYQGDDDEEDLEYVTGDEIYSLSDDGDDDDDDDDKEDKDGDDDF